jgi:excisionase family DNA binding protein
MFENKLRTCLIAPSRYAGTVERLRPGRGTFSENRGGHVGSAQDGHEKKAMREPTATLAEALAAILKPIVKEAVREAMNFNSRGAAQSAADKSFLTIKQAAEISRLGASTIRLAIRRRQLRAQRVGRRVLVKKSDLENFLEANPITTLPDKGA